MNSRLQLLVHSSSHSPIHPSIHLFIFIHFVDSRIFFPFVLSIFEVNQRFPFALVAVVTHSIPCDEVAPLPTPPNVFRSFLSTPHTSISPYLHIPLPTPSSFPSSHIRILVGESFISLHSRPRATLDVPLSQWFSSACCDTSNDYLIGATCDPPCLRKIELKMHSYTAGLVVMMR